MAKFNESYLILTKAEFDNDPKKFIHQNQGERGLTAGGIYESANPNALDWDFIRDLISLCEREIYPDGLSALERASVMAYADEKIKKQVYQYFKKYYWDAALLDEVMSQVQADNIFLSGVHIGVKSAVKLAQKVVQVQQDGVVGKYTLKALNFYDDNMFKIHFDKLEIQNYNNLIQKNPNLAWARNGFLNRVGIV